MLPRWHRALDRWPSRMSALRSSALRLRTALTKLPKWSPPPLNFLIDLAVGVEGDRAGVAGADQVAFAAVEDVADLDALAAASVVQAADLEDQLAVAVVEDADLRVGRLAVVDVAEAAADADDRPGQLVLAQAPAGLCPSRGCPGCPGRRCRSPRTSASRSAAACASAASSGPGRTRGRNRPSWESAAAARRPCRCCRAACSTGRGPA